MHETGCSGLMHWDDLEGWDGEGGGKGLKFKKKKFKKKDSINLYS